MNGLTKFVVFLLLLAPVLARADFWSSNIGQAAGATSLLLQPPVAFLSREPAPLMFATPYDATRLGIAVNYRDEGRGEAASQAQADGDDLARRFSATAVGEYAVSDHIGLFGKLGLRYSNSDIPTPAYTGEPQGRLSQLDRRFGFGVNVRANEVLSLHFEWERYASGHAADATALPLEQSWDPWRERNVFGAGVRLGF